MNTPAPRPVVLAWSGGKDSAWTLHVLRQDPTVEVVGLVTTVTNEHHRSSMQGVHVDVLHAQAEAAGLPLIESMIPANCTNEIYEAALLQTLAHLQESWDGLNTIAFGDLFLEDVVAYRRKLLEPHGWEVLLPLFPSDTPALARQMIAGGLKARLCNVDTERLDASFAGVSFDNYFLTALPDSVDPCGERGEFHTVVHDGPMFNRPIVIERGVQHLALGRYLYTDFTTEIWT